MSTIDTSQNNINSYMQNYQNYSINNTQSKDSVDISTQAQQSLSTSVAGSTSNPLTNSLNALVSNGTITQDQENAIQSALQAAKQQQ